MCVCPRETDIRYDCVSMQLHLHSAKHNHIFNPLWHFKTKKN